jgi:opacity protein-like surface antigen
VPKARRLAGTTIVIALVALVACARPLCAQGIEVAPFGGGRFGGDLFEVAAGQRLDADGAPALGVVFDFPLWNGLQFEGLVSRQEAHVLVPILPSGALVRQQIAVDQWQAGALQEFNDGPIRPFLTSAFGLTRYAADSDSEIRFSLGAGGGVKLFPLSHVGLRLDSRFIATFLDAGATAFACRPGACLVALHLNVAWQAEFTAGLVFKFR